MILPLVDHLCVYNSNRFVVSVLNLGMRVHQLLNEEIKIGYFLTLLDDRGLNQKQQHPYGEVQKTFVFFGTKWALKIYPSHAYIDLYLKEAYLISTIVFCLFLIALFIFGQLRNKGFKLTHPVEFLEVRHLRQLALFDQMTNLPNREYCLEYLDTALSRAQRHAFGLSLCYIDCDDFKAINDTYGHYVGDQLLKHIGEVVSKKIRQYDLFARLSGDEFCLILENIKSENEVHFILDKLVQAIAEPVQIDGHVLSIKMSAGVAMYPEHGKTAESLLIYADKAM